MSPLARPVLALAAAATLLAACAASPAYRPNNQGKVYPGECSRLMNGRESITKLTQPKVDVPAGVSVVQIKNDCWDKSGLELVGEEVIACSGLVSPIIKMGDWPAYSRAIISSQDGSTKPNQVYVEQYCI